MTKPSLNAQVAPLLHDLIDNADALRVGVSKGSLGETLIDCGVDAVGGLEAGRHLAEICLGGLGVVTFETASTTDQWPFLVTVHTSQPVLACLGSQYAGWSLSGKDGDGNDFYFLGSGPARAMGSSEPLFKELDYCDKAETAALVIESDKAPPAVLVEEVAKACGLSPKKLVFLYAPTWSLAGTVQVAGRSLEVALHKAHELDFPLENIVDGMATVPIPPPIPGFVEAMGRTNDAIIYGGRAHLYVEGDEAAAKKLAEELPSANSKDYGKPFAEIFAAVNGDFYQIDPMLFSPAKVTVTSLSTGKSFEGGAIDDTVLNRSFS